MLISEQQQVNDLLQKIRNENLTDEQLIDLSENILCDVRFGKSGKFFDLIQSIINSSEELRHISPESDEDSNSNN